MLLDSSVMMTVTTIIYVIVRRASYLDLIPLTLNVLLVWSNFEIADMDLWRSKAYSDYFDFLDEQGGFYYEVSLVTSCGRHV
jgi:hypothetical protein